MVTANTRSETTTPALLSWSGGLGLVAFLAVCFAVAATGGMATSASLADWYAQLRKPAFTPPDWVFGPVWSVLYVMIAVSGWLVWRRRGIGGALGAMTLYGLQLAANMAWSVLFFGLQSPFLGLIDIVLLAGLIVATAVAFARYDRLAAWLLAPYALWVGYAGALNAAIWIIN